MNQLSSHMASVFHCAPRFPIQSLHCQFGLPVSKPAWHVHLRSCFYSTRRLLTNLLFCCTSEVCFHCRIALAVLTSFVTTKLSSLLPLISCQIIISLCLKSHLSAKRSILGLLSRLLCNSVSVMSLHSLPSSLTFS